MKLLLFIFPFFFIACQNQDSSINANEFNASDSTRIINSILDSMKVEFNNQWFMQDIENHTTCSTAPYYGASISIDINKNESILLNMEFLNPKNISDSIVQFYSLNKQKNDPASNAPLYTSLSKKEILDHIETIERELKRTEGIKDYSQDIIDYRNEELLEWKGKLKIITTLKTDILKMPEQQSGVKLNYPKDCKINNELMDTILIGFYKLREIDAQHYFKDSYAKIFWKATLQKDSIALDQIETLKVLHPIAILDRAKCRLYAPIMVKIPDSSMTYESEKNDQLKIVNPFKTIERIFNDYNEGNESTDSQSNLDSLKQSLQIITNSKLNENQLTLIINVWMYYTVTDFPTREFTEKVLKTHKEESISAIEKRIKNKKDWEKVDQAPYSELNHLLESLKRN